jgi:hypothetical protein
MMAKALPSSAVFVISVLFGTRGFCGTCVIDNILRPVKKRPPIEAAFQLIFRHNAN